MLQLQWYMKIKDCVTIIWGPHSHPNLQYFNAHAHSTNNMYHRSWCKYLHSVEYIGLVDTNGKEDETNNINSSNVPLRTSKWTVGVKGLRFRWVKISCIVLSHWYICIWKAFVSLPAFIHYIYIHWSDTHSANTHHPPKHVTSALTIL